MKEEEEEVGGGRCVSWCLRVCPRACVGVACDITCDEQAAAELAFPGGECERLDTPVVETAEGV